MEQIQLVGALKDQYCDKHERGNNDGEISNSSLIVDLASTSLVLNDHNSHLESEKLPEIFESKEFCPLVCPISGCSYILSQSHAPPGVRGPTAPPD